MIELIVDDESVRAVLTEQLAALGHAPRTYPSGADFLKSWQPEATGVALLSLRAGPEPMRTTLQELHAAGVDMPVVALAAEADVTQAVRTIRAGAFDYVVHPSTPERLASALTEALAEEARRDAIRQERLSAKKRLEELTAREREVLERLLLGERNKVVAERLRIAAKTVEHHRAAIFRKLGVGSLAEAALHYQAARKSVA